MTEEIPSTRANGEAQLKAIHDMVVDGIVTIDERGVMESVNPAAERLFGYSANEMIGCNVCMLMPTPHRDQHDDYLKNYLETGVRKIIGIGRNVDGLRKDGSTFPLYLAVSESSIGGRRVFIGFLHNLTELRQVEEQALRLGKIIEDSVNEILVFDTQSLQMLFVNHAAVSHLGYAHNELLKLTLAEIRPDFHRHQFDEMIHPLATGKILLLRFETLHRRKDLSTYPVSVRLQKANWEGQPAYVAMVLDISSQVEARKEVQQRDQQLQFMIEHLPGAAAYVNHATGEVQFNQVIERITGYTPEQLGSIDLVFSLLMEKSASARDRYEKLRKNWSDAPLRLTVKCRTGENRKVEFRGYGYDGHEVWLLHDVTERDRYESELRLRDRAIQATKEGVVIADATRLGTPIVFANQAFESLTGFSADETIGRGCDLLCGATPEPEALLGLRDAISQKKNFESTTQFIRKDGGFFWSDLSVAPVYSANGVAKHIVAVMTDVSQQKAVQQQLLQSERLAAVGQVVAGLSHESRNALQRAQACLDMLGLDLQDQPESLELTEKIRRALTDLHRHYEEVRNYAAPINLKRHPTDLQELWNQTWSDLEASRFGRDFELIEEVGDASWICIIDRHRIHQVFRNIMENALSACSDPGQLTISCSECTIDGKESVRVSFRDNGPGVDEQTAKSVFQPFFTTKQKGTGLGMAISKRIIDAHGGRILVEQPSAGAEIVIELPC